MPLLRHLEEFCTESGNISTYLDCVEQFFITNDIGYGNQTKCNAILLTTIGEKTYRVLEDLHTSQKPSDKSLEEITQLLLEHFKPKHLVVTESFKFYNAKQEEGESISNFFIRLKHLAPTCEFRLFLKRALSDKFVCGLKDNRIQEKLLSEDKLLEEAVKMAKAMELAMPNVAHLKEKETDEVKMSAEYLIHVNYKRKKSVFWVWWKMAREILIVSSMGKDVF